jgi:hypothetical protein
MIGECRNSYTLKSILDIDKIRRIIVATNEKCFVLIQRAMLSQWRLSVDVDQDGPSPVLAVPRSLLGSQNKA